MTLAVIVLNGKGKEGRVSRDTTIKCDHCGKKIDKDYEFIFYDFEYNKKKWRFKDHRDEFILLGELKGGGRPRKSPTSGRSMSMYYDECELCKKCKLLLIRQALLALEQKKEY
jgi:hypothetical protein